MTTPAYYFAYGSNISAAAWGRWRRERGLPKGLLRFLGRATLPDHRLACHYHSSTWSGGALDVVPELGAAVPGALFELRPGARSAVERKEGAPGFYREVAVEVVLEDGRHLRAITYVVTDGRKESTLVPLAPAYLQAVRDAYASRNIRDASMLDAACSGRTVPKVDQLTVYGTLRRGQPRYRLLEDLGARYLDTVRLTGRLHHCGAWPAAVLHGPGEGVVAELWKVPDVTRALAALDRVEGFVGWNARGSLFHRTLVRVPDGAAPSSLAWAWVQDEPVGPVLASGDWTTSTGGR